jgi:hypothetical protein
MRALLSVVRSYVGIVALSSVIVGFLGPQLTFAAVVFVGRGHLRNIDDLMPLYLVAALVFGPLAAAGCTWLLAARHHRAAAVGTTPVRDRHMAMTSGLLALASLAATLLLAIGWLCLPLFLA